MQTTSPKNIAERQSVFDYLQALTNLGVKSGNLGKLTNLDNKLGNSGNKLGNQSLGESIELLQSLSTNQEASIIVKPFL